MIMSLNKLASNCGNGRKYAAVSAVFITSLCLAYGMGQAGLYDNGFLQALQLIMSFLQRKWRVRIFSKMPVHLEYGQAGYVLIVFWGFHIIFLFT
jgi:hypothetical protein